MIAGHSPPIITRIHILFALPKSPADLPSFGYIHTHSERERKKRARDHHHAIFTCFTSRCLQVSYYPDYLSPRTRKARRKKTGLLRFLGSLRPNSVFLRRHFFLPFLPPSSPPSPWSFLTSSDRPIDHYFTTDLLLESWSSLSPPQSVSRDKPCLVFYT